MRWLIVGFLILSVFHFAFFFEVFMGYTYGDEYSGWTLGTGFYQDPFGSDINFTFQMGTPTQFAFHFTGFIPIFSAVNLEIGPTVSYLRSDFSGDWKDESWVGVVVESRSEVYHARVALLYPTFGEFDFSRDVHAEFRYFLKPPEGLVFKDRLFFSVLYSGGIFRFGVGLLEPLP